jgi:hypothetical protein
MGAIERQRRAALRDSLLIARAAQAPGKAFKAFLREIDGGE